MNTKQRDDLLAALQSRFDKNMKRHKGVDWSSVQDAAEDRTGKAALTR